MPLALCLAWAGTRAVVIVSGEGSITPFTTPSLACKRGLAAGNTATALRSAPCRATAPGRRGSAMR